MLWFLDLLIAAALIGVVLVWSMIGAFLVWMDRTPSPKQIAKARADAEARSAAEAKARLEWERDRLRREIECWRRRSEPGSYAEVMEGILAVELTEIERKLEA